MIVTRTKTTEAKVFSVSGNPYSRYTEGWRRIRAEMEVPLDACWLCHKKFEDNEEIYLMITSKGNKVLCTGCAQDMFEILGDGNQWKRRAG